jgi:hypothetical protein
MWLPWVSRAAASFRLRRGEKLPSPPPTGRRCRCVGCGESSAVRRAQMRARAGTPPMLAACCRVERMRIGTWLQRRADACRAERVGGGCTAAAVAGLERASSVGLGAALGRSVFLKVPPLG